MKRYIKPNTEITAMNVASYMLAASGEPNQATPGGNVFTGGNSSESTASVDENGNVEDMAKDYNAWTAWDE